MKKKAKKTTKKVAAKPRKRAIGPVNVGILLDATGSMAVRWHETIDGLNTYVKKLAGDAKEKYAVLVRLFNEYERKDITSGFQDVKSMLPWSPGVYTPNHCTPLLDATAEIVGRMEQEKASRRTLLVVITDGMENASRKETFATVKDLLTRKQKQDGWSVVFLGADMDAWDIGQSMGIPQANTVAYRAGAIGQSIAAAASSTMSYASVTNRGGTVGPITSGLVNTGSAEWDAVVTDAQKAHDKTAPK